MQIVIEYAEHLITSIITNNAKKQPHITQINLYPCIAQSHKYYYQQSDIYFIQARKERT